MKCLEILQINLGKSRAATAHLEETCCDINPNFVFIQEPHVYNKKVIGIPLHYTTIAATSPKCAIIVRDKTCSIFILLLQPDMIIVKCNYADIEIILINVYLSPRADFQHFLLNLNSVISPLNNPNLIIAGDFNAKNTLWGGNITDDRGEELSEFLLLNNLFLLNNRDSLPTFESARGTSWIDISAVSGNLLSQVAHWDVLEIDSLSDHQYVSFGLFNATNTPVKKITLQGLIKLYNIIQHDSWFENIIIHSNKESIEHVLSKFYDKFNRWVKQCERNVKGQKRTTPWWNAELQQTRLRNNAYRRRYQRCNNFELRNSYKREYYDYKQYYKDLIISAKMTSWHSFCFEATKKSLFGIPYKLAFNKITTTAPLPPIIKTDYTYTTSHTESIIYILNNLFRTDSTETDSQLISTLRERIVSPHLGPSDPNFTYQEINTIIMNLRTKTAPGLDKITASMVKQLWQYKSSFMLSLFNSCLKAGHFPHCWKKGKIILLNKPNRPTDEVNSYRPICLNSIFGKVLEKLIYTRLYFFLVQSKLIHPNQFGFTHHRSSTLALYNLTQHLEYIKESSNIAILISLDFSGAFDSLCYPLVLDYLQIHKCPNNIYSLLSSFFVDRSVSYISSNLIEINKKVSLGCPQGSPLSPVLWNILINDLLCIKFPLHAHLQAFADDVILVIKGNSRREIENRAESILSIIYNWAQERKLLFNYAKCLCLLISKGTKYQNRPPSVIFNHHRLTFQKELKILGVIFDSHLSFLPHVKYLKTKVVQHTVNLSRFSSEQWGITSSQFRKIYLLSIERYMVYGAPVWWKPERSSHLKRGMMSVQRVPLLKICHGFHTIPNLSLPILCNIIPINITLNIEVFMFKLFQLKQNAQFYDWNVLSSEVDYPFDIWNIHPSKRYAIQYQHYNQQQTIEWHNEINVYTDGSACLGRVGAAFVSLNQNKKILQIGRYTLPSYSTVFDAEAVAILRGLEYLKAVNGGRDCNIYTDSLSVLQALANPVNVNPIICKLKK